MRGTLMGLEIMRPSTAIHQQNQQITTRSSPDRLSFLDFASSSNAKTIRSQAISRKACPIRISKLLLLLPPLSGKLSPLRFVHPGA
jgi:hypothetical protein